MTEKISIKEKIELLQKPYITISEIQSIFEIGQLQATNVRNIAIEKAKNDHRYVCRYKVPTDIVMNVLGYKIDYFVTLANLTTFNKECANEC